MIIRALTRCTRKRDAAVAIYQIYPPRGIARVVCYSPRHDLTLAELSRTRSKIYARLAGTIPRTGSRPEIEHVLIFENKGEAVGVSNPHPHCQIYANNFVFKTIENEAEASERYLAENGQRAVSGRDRSRKDGWPADNRGK